MVLSPVTPVGAVFRPVAASFDDQFRWRRLAHRQQAGWVSCADHRSPVRGAPGVRSATLGPGGQDGVIVQFPEDLIVTSAGASNATVPS